MKTKHFLIAVMAVLTSAAMTGCKSTKSVQSASTEVTVPLTGKEFQSDKDYFRASQLGKSPDLATAKKIALQNATQELAGNIQSLIKRVTENYTNQRAVADKQEFENKFEENARAVVNQMLNDVKIIGEKVFTEKDGAHTYYVAIEMSKEPVVYNISNRISKDAKLQLDFDKHQFQKVFDEEMEKFEAQQ
jgi:hypothetical protein